MSRNEADLIKALKTAASTRDLKYLCLDLMELDLEVERLAQLAARTRASQILGYLSEITAQACESNGSTASAKLYQIAEKLSFSYGRWKFLNPALPEFAKRIISSRPQAYLNRKWKVYATLNAQEIKDWISLHRAGRRNLHERKKTA